MEVADRRRRAEQRDLAAGDQVVQDQHVVALVRVERPPCRQVDEAEDRRHGEDREEADSFEHRLVDATAETADEGCHGFVGQRLVLACVRTGRSVAQAGDASTSGSGAVRARLPRRVIAPGGSGASGRPSARAIALAMLIASYPSSIPGVSR